MENDTKNAATDVARVSEEPTKTVVGIPVDEDGFAGMKEKMEAKEAKMEQLQEFNNEKDEVRLPNMRNIKGINAIKIMNGKYGGAFYVRYLFDQSNGRGWLQLIIKYPTDETVGVTIYKNVCRIVESIEPHENICDIECNIRVSPRTVNKKNIMLTRKESFNSGDYDAFQAYERPDMPIPIMVIWEQIVKRWEQIPIVNVHSVFTPQDVYEAMLEFGESKDGQYADSVGYYLTRSEMEDICNDYGIPFSTIRVSFESRGLFDKDATTLGYQKSKKIDGKKRNFYHLKKCGFNRSISSDDEGAIEYTEKTERMIQYRPLSYDTINNL